MKGEGQMLRRHFLLSAVAVALACVSNGVAAQPKMVLKASDVHPLGYPTVQAVEPSLRHI